jgi:uncharacterized protein
MPNAIIKFPRRLLQLLIRAYQRTLSLDHGIISKFMRHPTCRFHPTCSEYAHQAIGKYGVIRGIPMAVWRVLRCNPWSDGGNDPVA